MADEDLLIDIKLSEKNYARTLANMEANTVRAANRMEKSFKSSNRTLERNFDKANKGANVLASNGLRNVSMQLSQVAQQASATGDPIRALAIQLPDIGLAFGTIGIAAGVAAGAILPLIANTESSVDAAKEAKTAVEAYMNAVSRMREAVALADTSLADLTQRYGENAEAAREAAVIQAKVAAAGAERDAQAAFATVNAQREEVDNLVLRYDEILLRLERTKQLVEAQEAPSNQLVRIEGERALLAQQIETITGRNVDDQRELSNLIGQMVDAMSDGTITEEFRSAAERALELARATGEVDPELEKALDRAIQLELTEAEIKKLMDLIAGSASNVAANIAIATGEAIRLGTALAQAAQSQAAAGQSTASIIQDYIDNPTFERGERPSTGPKPAPANPDFGLPAATSGGGGGGSGGGGGIDEELREAQRLFEETRTDAEEYAAEVERIQQLHAKGLLDEDTFTRALDMVAEEYDQAAQAADAFAEVSGMFGDAIIDAAMGGTDAMEDLARAIQRALLQAALLGEGPLSGLFSGFGEGGLLGNLFGGFRAKGGPVVPGKSYIVGEDGPELFTPGSPGQIVPNGSMVTSSSTASGGGAAQRVEVEVYVNDDGTLGAVARAAGAAAGAAAAPNAVANDIARNGVTSRALRGSFALPRNKRGR